MKKAFTAAVFLLLFACPALAAEAQNTQDLLAQVTRLQAEVEKMRLDSQRLEGIVDKLSALAAPLEEQKKKEDRRRASRLKFEEKSKRDAAIYSSSQISHAWKMHLQAQYDWGSKRAVKLLKKVIADYPRSNLAGCSVVYLGQMLEGEESEKYFRLAIDQYNDCFYGDGVQVGALARYYLSIYYRNYGEPAKAELLLKELREKFPEAINHKGDLLTKSE